MRSPNQEKIKEECCSSISKLMSKFNLGKVHDVHQDKNGWVNPCFFVNDKYVIRFNARDSHLPKFQREKFVYDQLKTSSAPVPQKVILDDSKDICTYDVLISEKIRGLNLESVWTNIGQPTRTVLARKAGEHQKHLNEQEFSFFGEFALTGPFHRHSTWEACLLERLNYHLQDTDSLSIFSDHEASHFMTIFNRYLSLFESVTSSRLVHGDYHFGNLLVENSEITAVLDFEWSFAGDPLFDLSNWSESYPVWQEIRPSFLAGLGISLTSDDELRLKVYKMIRNIELCAVAKRYFSNEEAKEYKKTTLKRIENL